MIRVKIISPEFYCRQGSGNNENYNVNKIYQKNKLIKI